MMTQHPQPSSNCEENTIFTPVGAWTFSAGPSIIGPGDEAEAAAAAQMEGEKEEETREDSEEEREDSEAEGDEGGEVKAGD